MFVTLEKARERYDICRTCENFQPDLKICKKCGCFMPLKVTIAQIACPIKLWPTSYTSSIHRTYTIED